MAKVNLRVQGEGIFFIQESIKSLRANLQFCGADKRVLLFTSCKEDEGKSTITMNLAKSFSELEKRTLLIDADMRKSVLMGRNSDGRNLAGLSELLTRISPMDDCVHKTQYEYLDIVFSGKFPPNPAELLSGEYFAKLIEAAKDVYDYILIDTPPLGRVVDAAVIATQCDGSVLVIGDSKLSYKTVQSVSNQLKKAGPVLGVVRNNVKGKSKGKYKNYRGYY